VYSRRSTRAALRLVPIAADIVDSLPDGPFPSDHRAVRVRFSLRTQAQADVPAARPAAFHVLSGPWRVGEGATVSTDYGDACAWREGDWVGLYEVGARDDAHESRWYRERVDSEWEWEAKFGPRAPGPHELRYFTRDWEAEGPLFVTRVEVLPAATGDA
jgi:hypothetical protein